MRALFIALSLFIVSGSLFSQEIRQKILKQLSQSFYTIADVSLTNENYAGSPFLTDSFRNGKLLLTTGEVLEEVSLKFDLYQHRLLVKTSDSTFVPEMLYIAAFELDSLNTTGREYYKRINVKNTSYYYQIVERGRAYLYICKKKTIHKATGNDFKFEEMYFVSVDNGSLVKLKRSKRGFKQCFPDNQYYLDLYITAHKLDVEKLSDIRRLVAYYNRMK